MREALERALALAECALIAAANLCLLAMLAINGVNIAVRGIFDRSFPWVWPLTVVLSVWMTFAAFYVIYRRGKDITVDYFVKLGGSWAMRATRILADLVIIALMVLLLIEAPQVLQAQVGEIDLTGLPRWSMSVPLFMSAALILIDHLLDLAAGLRGAPERHADPVSLDA